MKRLSRSANIVRIGLLVVVLLVVIVGAVWEFGMSLPGFRNAMDGLELISKNHQDDPQSRADVIKKLGATASSEFKKFDLSSEAEKMFRHQRTDRYRWSRVIPGKDPLEILVVYNAVVSGDDVDSFDPKTCSDDRWMFKSFFDPGNAPVEVTVQTKSSITPEKIFFSNNDEDSDGFLSEKEIPARSSISQKMDWFDPDGDKKISYEEFLKAVELMEKELGKKLTNAEYDLMYGGASPVSMSPDVGNEPEAPGVEDGKKKNSKKEKSEGKKGKSKKGRPSAGTPESKESESKESESKESESKESEGKDSEGKESEGKDAESKDAESKN